MPACSPLSVFARGGGYLWAWGFCIGSATSIKPQAALLGITATALTAWVARRRGRSATRPLLFSCAGAAIPLAVCLVFLLREQALGSFIDTTRTLTLLHASLGRHSLAFLLGHAIPAQLLPLVLVPLLGVYLRPAGEERAWTRWEGTALLLFAAFGFSSFILQGKAYSYHRASLVAFLLCLSMVELVRMTRSGGRVSRSAALVTLAYAVFWLMPASTVRALRWDTREPTLLALQADLTTLERAKIRLAERGIQCLDTTAGCITVLSRMQAVQATGFLYDCYFFAPGDGPVVDEQRKRFWAAIAARPPQVFVVTDQYCFGLPSSYRKLDQWPELKELLARKYTLVVERPPADLPRRGLATWPFGYRIYTRTN